MMFSEHGQNPSTGKTGNQATSLSVKLIGERPAQHRHMQADLGNTVVSAAKSGDISSMRRFHRYGLDVNVDHGELMATAAENGHLELLAVMCEEMGGILTGSKCDYPFFRRGLKENVKKYLDNRVGFEALHDMRCRPQRIKRKLSIFRIADSKIH
ncbi:MAG: hypothetical protein EP349_04120 [Alphaproteobacteria bacterium]|nr:MAG: hypothetical protein EP349_04120 [Alphaproteobacteria bacterium]